MDRARISGSLTPIGSVTGALTVPERVTPAAYTGETHITPTQSQQILETRDLFLTENITIDPIPNNYGLITWNGSVLTVS